jgi:hypothetical protein
VDANRTEGVLNQMLRGFSRAKVIASPRDKARFRKKHEPLALWILGLLPNRWSYAVPAVLGKCALKYGPKRVEEFCNALSNQVFKGRQDPAHVLWQYLVKYKGRDSLEIYRRTITAARAYMEGRQVNNLRAAGEDIFEWDKNFDPKITLAEAISRQVEVEDACKR